jgi:hypothetical protein
MQVQEKKTNEENKSYQYKECCLLSVIGLTKPCVTGQHQYHGAPQVTTVLGLRGFTCL